MNDFGQQVKDGLHAYERGDYSGARKIFADILLVKPYASDIHLNLGNVYFKLEQWDEAETHFRKAIELDPVESHAYLNLGNLYFKRKQFEDAVHYWEIFKTLNVRHSNIWLNLGLAYDQLKEPDKALESYSGFIARSPDAPEVPQIRQRFEQAKKVFEHNVQVAEALLKQGKKQQASDILQKALQSYPGNAAIYKTQANLLYQSGQWGEALKQYQKSYQQKPDDLSCLINIGVLHEKLNQPLGALWAYHAAHGFSSPERNQLAQRFAQLLQQHQRHLPEALQSAQNLFRRGKWRQAESQLKQLVELSEYFPDQGAEVTRWLNTVQDALNPSHKAVKIYLARAQDAEQEGKFDHALNFYQKVLSAQPQGAQAQVAQQNIARIKAVMAAAIRSFLSSG